MKLNPEMLPLGGRIDPEIEVPPVLDGVVLLFKKQVCHLKVLLDMGLLMDKQGQP